MTTVKPFKREIVLRSKAYNIEKHMNYYALPPVSDLATTCRMLISSLLNGSSLGLVVFTFTYLFTHISFMHNDIFH